MESIEIFSGAGGLALGMSRAGFEHQALVERDRDSCQTINVNRVAAGPHGEDWPEVRPTDVTQFDFTRFRDVHDELTLIAAGPPCQPFSLGGKHRAHLDPRDMFPEVVRAVRQARPRALVVENVRGIQRKTFADYLEYILLQFRYPDVTPRPGEDMVAHLERLRSLREQGVVTDLTYNIHCKLLNAADFGVPQRRERVFIVGFRSDLGVRWSFDSNLMPTHSRERLLWDQWVTGTYWERHGLGRPAGPPERFQMAVRRLTARMDEPTLLPWRTVRDTIGDLPNPRENPINGDFNHLFYPGAKTYKGHTGSPLDEPAKTIKAGDHGVPGGENMLRYPNGRVRYFSVREAARLQCFPDDYVFRGSWTEMMRQLGNAVPVTLAERVGQSVGRELERVAQAA